MSSVLSKKIKAGAGIPPTILQFNAFWEPLHAKVSAWMHDVFSVETPAVLAMRRVNTGDAALMQLEGLLTFAFSGSFSPGVCAISIDVAGADMNAAQRLQQEDEGMEGVSPLFRKLLFEAPAIALWQKLSADFPGHLAIGGPAPLADISQTAGGFEPAERYLQVCYACTRGQQTANVWLSFKLDYVIDLAANFVAQAVNHRESTGPHGQTVLRESLLSSAVTVEGILERITMTIGDCSRLEVGQLLPLPDVNTANVSLRAETVNGPVEIGHCVMGVWKTQRALKLNTPILEPFTRELAKL